MEVRFAVGVEDCIDFFIVDSFYFEHLIFSFLFILYILYQILNEIANLRGIEEDFYLYKEDYRFDF